MRNAHVLTYHSGNIAGRDYSTNDLIALREDLRIMRSSGITIVPLRTLVDALLTHALDRLPDRVVAITLDDGLDFDFIELDHPTHGRQTSVLKLMQDFATEFNSPVHATSFVIASPEARAQIADREMRGHRWISESWWADAVRTGFFHIANHTWDHVSPSVDVDTSQRDRRGSARFIDDRLSADLQVRRAQQYIEHVAPNPGTALLAFPYGDYSDYLIHEYLPDAAMGHNTLAAFCTRPGVIVEDSDPWQLPRNTRGVDWNSPESLMHVLSA